MADTPATIEQESMQKPSPVHPVRLVVFAVLSVAFLVWVTFGQVEARVWVSSQLTLLDRRISGMWQYLGNNLPDLPASGFFSLVYWLSISVVVIGTVAGLWLFLGTEDEDPNSEPLEVTHAAHLQHDTE